jgi:DNA invertase Pin-like site-specific DNA recombinase
MSDRREIFSKVKKSCTFGIYTALKNKRRSISMDNYNNDNQSKIAVVYARYSSDRQNEQSIDGQLRVCQEFADRNGIKIVATYIDRAMTGTNDNREDFQRMLRDSDKKEWDYVLLYKLDRFSRNKYEMAIHRKHLKDNGIKIISAMENIPDTPEGVLLESLLEGMNQYYSEELSQKTRRGMNETRLKGHYPGGGTINYGWSLIPVYTEQNGKQVKTASKVIINEEEAPIVKEIFSEYANGKTVADIVQDFKERGILNRGKDFRLNILYKMLRQEKYTGIYRLNGKTYDNIYPQIISVDVYNVVRARVEANKHGSHPKTDHPYLLKGKIFCGNCGRHMSSCSGTSKAGKIHRYYKCAHRAPCPQAQSIKKEVLEQTITQSFERMLSTRSNFDLLVDKILETFNNKLHDATQLRIAEKELQRIEKAINNLITAVENGFYSESTNERLKELENRKDELKEEIVKERIKEVKPLDRKQVAKYLSYAIAQPSQKVIDLLVRKVVIKGDAVDVYLKYSDKGNDDAPPKLGRPKNSEKNPERNLSEQGFLLLSYIYSYIINPQQTTTRDIVIHVMI